MSMKVRIFKGDVEFPDLDQDAVPMYFFASNLSRHPSQLELDSFLNSCPFHFIVTEYDAVSGIGLADIVWPLDSDSGDIELSSSPNGGALLFSAPDPKANSEFKLSLSAFYDLLEAHDWYCHFAEDAIEYNAGLADLAVIGEQAKKGGADFLALLNEYRMYMYTGKRWGTPQLLKPSRPDGLSFIESILVTTTHESRQGSSSAGHLGVNVVRTDRDQLH